MANRSFRYTILWSFRQDGNRAVEDAWRGTATSVPRAISKMVKELNVDANGDPVPDDEVLKASDLFILDVRADQLNIAHETLKNNL